jgi:hypothetical protein
MEVQTHVVSTNRGAVMTEAVNRPDAVDQVEDHGDDEPTVETEPMALSKLPDERD